MKKILSIFGTRPEAIKMAPVILNLKSQIPNLKSKICVTAQHRDMLDDVLTLFKIRPDYDLNIMKENQSLDQLTCRGMEKLTPILKKEKPDLVLVHGDTTTAFLASLACFYLKIPVGHVEAGLRSYDYLNPFPEEANRRVADALCSLHFAPTQSSKKNLLKENISSKGILVTGNTVIDALQWAVRQPHKFQNKTLKKFLDSSLFALRSSLILVTAHRRENFGAPLINICSALRQIADQHPDASIVYPVHLNPNVQSTVKKILSDHQGILLLPPLNYFDLCHLMKKSYLVVTDSGGLQEEAPSLGKPVLVLRKITERPEAVRTGTVKIIGTEKEKIINEITRLLTDPAAYKKMANAVNPYGDGQASERIVQFILYYFGINRKKPVPFIS